MATTARPASYITLLTPSPKAFQDIITFYVNTAHFRENSAIDTETLTGNVLSPVQTQVVSGGKQPPSDSKLATWLVPMVGNAIHVLYDPNAPPSLVNVSPATEVEWESVILGTWSSVDLTIAQASLRKLRAPFKVFQDPVTSSLAITCKDPLGNCVTFSNWNAINSGSAPSITTPHLFQPALEVPGLHPESNFDFSRPDNGSPDKRIGILCSGGDSCGMNAAVRSLVRVALQRGCIPFAIYEGYQGLVEGGEKIRQMGWENVRGFLAVGGTVIGTARCAAFRQRSGRLDAAYNMIKNGIDALVVVGGDGSLTGADLLRSEWEGLCDELVSTKRLTAAETSHLRNHLAIVGMVGSIDNDMCSTDITIGAISALHRICESVDNLVSTANSHRRAFVIEVMGRHCGWLALMAAIAVGAETVFLPERPPPFDTEKYNDDWASEMCDTVQRYRSMGNRKSLIIVCEGAIDRHLKPIKSDDVKCVLEQRLSLDTRVTQLGHVQRGGFTCAFDRYLATVQGVEAVNAILESTPDSVAPMIGMSESKIVSVPLMEAVNLTKQVSEAIAQKDFARAMELRDPYFAVSFKSYMEVTHFDEKAATIPSDKRVRIGIIHTGAPAGGMNAATRVAARLCLSRGHTPIAIKHGFSGLVKDDIKVLNWQDVIGWQAKGGSELGTNRDHPQPLPNSHPKISPKGMDTMVDMGQIAYHIQKNNIQGLLVIGGFEAFTSVLTLTQGRLMYPSLCIPMVHLPATISNNCPGTDFSIGSDTALNAIVESCDCIKLSANALRKRVFIVEVQGGQCGYLATLGGLISGATTSYIPEEGISLPLLQRDIQHLMNRYCEEDELGIPNEGRVILRAELTPPDTYTTETVSKIFTAEGQGVFDSRTAVLGHLQQGLIPSPMDRIRASRLACMAVDWIEAAAAQALEESAKLPGMEGQVYTTRPEHAVVVGILGTKTVFTPVTEILKETDLKTRRGKLVWWKGLGRLTRVLSKYEFNKKAMNKAVTSPTRWFSEDIAESGVNHPEERDFIAELVRRDAEIPDELISSASFNA